jgi:hypothetical protein
MFKKIVEFFTGKSAEKGLAYTDKFAAQAPYKVEPPATAVPPAVNDQITDSVTQAQPKEEKPVAVKKPAKPKKPAEPKKSAPAKKPKKASK